MKRMLSRLAPFVTFRSSDWELHGFRQTIIVLCAFICSIGTIAGFYDWRRGHTSILEPFLWALPVVLLHLISPDRRLLATVVLAFFAIYGLRGLILTQDPFGYYVIGISLVLIFLLVVTTPARWKPH